MLVVIPSQKKSILPHLVGNVLDMSLGQVHVLNSQGQNWTAGHIFCRICSVRCPQRVLQVSHMSSIPPGTKKLVNQPNLTNSSLEDKFDSSVYILLPKSFLWNYKTNINSKMKKMRLKEKIFFANTKIASRSKSHLSPPLCPSCSFHFFLFFYFDKNFVIKLIWGRCYVKLFYLILNHFQF